MQGVLTLTKSTVKKISSFRSIGKFVFWNPCFTIDCRDITVLASTTVAFIHFILYYTPFTIYPHLLFAPIYYFPPFTVYPHLLFTPINYLILFTIYPHLLFTPIYYVPPFTIIPPLLLYPLYYFRALRLIGSRSEDLFLVQNILIQCQR